MFSLLYYKSGDIVKGIEGFFCVGSNYDINVS